MSEHEWQPTLFLFSFVVFSTAFSSASVVLMRGMLTQDLARVVLKCVMLSFVSSMGHQLALVSEADQAFARGLSLRLRAT